MQENELSLEPNTEAFMTLVRAPSTVSSNQFSSNPKNQDSGTAAHSEGFVGLAMDRGALLAGTQQILTPFLASAHHRT
jgi:hypothetical protein